jgi:hypothetical protein
MLSLVVLGSDIRHARATDGNGGATRTWVSGVGDDANPCSRTAPCKTWAGAISKTHQPAGEIDALDPGGFGAVTITGGITLNGGPGNIAGVLVSGTNGINVQAAANDVVILRNLDFNGLNSGLSGISLISGQSLVIENSTIENFANDCVHIAPTAGGSVTLKNDILRSCGGNGVLAQAGTAPVSVLVENSTIQGVGGTAILATSGSGTNPAVVDIQNNRITGNNRGLGTMSNGTINSFGGNVVDLNVTNGAPTVNKATV